jgi:hypothetical protein
MDALPSLYGFGFTESLKLRACQASLRILKARSDVPPNILSKMLVGILQIIDISEITELVNKSLSNKILSPEQETLWRSVSLLLANQDLVNESTTYLHSKVHESKEHKYLCYKLLFQINNTPIFSQDPSLKASWLYRTISILGNVFPHTERESDSRRSTDSLDSQEIIRCIEHLISSLSALTTDESLGFIIKLLKTPELSRWSNHLKHASSTLKKKLREKNYHYLITQDVCNLLQGGKPATMRDLMEVFIDTLTDTQKDIRYGNGDSWKLFWDGFDEYDRLKPKHNRKVENACRNIVLDLMRPKLDPLEIHVLPEAQHANQKRADLGVFSSGIGQLPIEMKRDNHKDLWSAVNNQLDALYTVSPESHNYGVYVVFWFGDKKVKAPPQG